MVNGLKTKEAHDIILDASITGRIDMSKNIEMVPAYTKWQEQQIHVLSGNKGYFM